MLQNKYLVAKIGVDTADNEPSQVLGFYLIFIRPSDFILFWSTCKDLKRAFFRPNLNGILSEFREMIENSKILMRVTRKVQYFLEISGNDICGIF